jgi:muramoyltetrapeptide carboxypeptidase
METMPVVPARLRQGDMVAVVAPASPPHDPENINRSIHLLEELGFEVTLGPNVRKRWGYLAGSDRERAFDLMEVFSNPAVKGIFCVRGGYGTARLLDLLDFGVVRENPKVFVGYSDLTTLLAAFLTKANLVTYHGPFLDSRFFKNPSAEFTRLGLFRAVMETEPLGGICMDYPEPETVEIVHKGIASGPLIGGNLSVFCALMGTRFFPRVDGAILFLEDVSEAPYRIDRMLTHLENAGVLGRVAGIAVGICAHCEDPKAESATEFRQSLQSVLRERLARFEIPVVTGLPFGHATYNATLPYGSRATLDADRGDLILE